VRLYTAIFQRLKQIRITRLLTDSNSSSHRGRDNDRRQELRHFVHKTFPSQLAIIRSVMDDRQPQKVRSMHSASSKLDMQVVETL